LQITDVSPSTFYSPETGIENKLTEENPSDTFDLDLSTGHGFFEKTYHQPATPLSTSSCNPTPAQPPSPSPPAHGPCSLFAVDPTGYCNSPSTECSEWKLVWDKDIGAHMIPSGKKCGSSKGSGQDNTPEKKTVADDITIYVKLTVDKVSNEEGMPENPQISPVSVSSVGSGPPNLGTSLNALSSNQINNKSSVLEANDQNQSPSTDDNSTQSPSTDDNSTQSPSTDDNSQLKNTQEQMFDSGYNDGRKDCGKPDVIDSYKHSVEYRGHSEAYHNGYFSGSHSCGGVPLDISQQSPNNSNPTR